MAIGRHITKITVRLCTKYLQVEYEFMLKDFDIACVNAYFLAYNKKLVLIFICYNMISGDGNIGEVDVIYRLS